MRRALAMSSISALALLALAAGGSGCGSNNASLPDGGGLAGSPAAARRARGWRRRRCGRRPGTINCGDPYAPIDPTALIDDMETPDYMTVRAAGRAGGWWAGGDPTSPGASITPNGDAPAEPIPGGRCGSLHAMHVTGQGFTVWAVLSVSMGWGSVDGGAPGLLPYDDDFRTGLTFWARIGDTSSNKVRFAVSDKYSRPEGGFCVDGGSMDVACYDTFGVDLTQLDTTWTQYRIPFGGLTQRNFGLPRPKARQQQHLHDRVQLLSGHTVRLLARRHLVLLERKRRRPSVTANGDRSVLASGRVHRRDADGHDGARERDGVGGLRGVGRPRVRRRRRAADLVRRARHDPGGDQRGVLARARELQNLHVDDALAGGRARTGSRWAP